MSVCILMATWQGAAHLAAQLGSISAQTAGDWLLLASDDGSADGTLDLLAGFAADHPGRVRIMAGPGQGASANFLHLLMQPEAGAADHVAFCDQDDVWMADRLARGVAALADVPAGVPGLACGRTWVCDAALGQRRLSALPDRPAGFRHALVQNISSGNTLLLNRSAVALLRAAVQDLGNRAGALPYHDWWAYQMVAGAGGVVRFDPEPLLFYRQHAGNLVGSGHQTRALWQRPLRVISGRYGVHAAAQGEALAASSQRLTAENRALLAGTQALRKAGLVTRLRGLARLGLYRQGRAGRLALWAAAVAGRI